jgi:opacity protein-like surface antigen
MVFKRPLNAAPKQRKGINKLILGFASVAAAAVIGTTAFAAAAPDGKPTKEQCSSAGYKNYGQCVKDWAKQHGKGYGGGYGNTVNAEVNVELNNSDNNVIEIIFNIFQ